VSVGRHPASLRLLLLLLLTLLVLWPVKLNRRTELNEGGANSLPDSDDCMRAAAVGVIGCSSLDTVKLAVD